MLFANSVLSERQLLGRVGSGDFRQRWAFNVTLRNNVDEALSK
jgi:hypothetical protein